MSLCLSDKELIELTRRKQRRAQMEQLTYLGIPYRTTTTGELIVLRSDVTFRGRAQDDGFRPPKAMAT